MKNIVDVMSLQNRTGADKASVVDYRAAHAKGATGGLAARFLVECSVKLAMKPLTAATAAILFHRFFRQVAAGEYDEFLIASSSLYLAGKLKDDPVKIRDVINVAHSTLNRGASPLELGEEYWAMRDGITQAELLITRMLKFNLDVVHSHKVSLYKILMATHIFSWLMVSQYMLHYMITLQSWFGAKTWSALPVAKKAAGYLQDFHSSAAVLDYKASHIACCALSLAFQTYGVQVPLTDEFDENTVWYSVSVHCRIVNGVHS